MQRKTVLAGLVILFASVVVSLAADMNMGTCKLNEEKSKLNPMGTKNDTVVYEAAGDSVKVTVDGTAKDGKPFHSEWTGKFDGKDYPVTGDRARAESWFGRYGKMPGDLRSLLDAAKDVPIDVDPVIAFPEGVQ